MADQQPVVGQPEPVAPPRPGSGEPVAGTPGWREVLSIAAIVVGVVFAIQVITSLLPASLQDVVFRTPLTIVVLVAGTIGLLAWIARRPAV